MLLRSGWRRSGRILYRNMCRACSLCIPVRIPVAHLRLSKSQRRCLKKNQDLEVRVCSGGYTEERYQVHAAYAQARHEEAVSREDFQQFLCESPTDTRVSEYRVAGTLIGVGWLDVVDDGMSSVYFSFLPEYSRRSLGIFSVLKEARIVRELGLPYYYLGFWVPGSPKMDYKARFAPLEMRDRKGWQRINPEEWRSTLDLAR